MKFVAKSHRNADSVLASETHKRDFQDIVDVIHSITDEELIERHQRYKNFGLNKGLAPAINGLLKKKFIAKGWKHESSIFQGKDYQDKVWRLDFAQGTASIEVAFNHGEAIAWNLLKPVLASEVNHVEKAIQTEVGILITATKDLKIAGAMDNATGEYEKILRYLTPLRNYLTVPILIIGLEAPETFRLKPKYAKPKLKDWGIVERFDELPN
jgi:hypothetical protein